MYEFFVYIWSTYLSDFIDIIIIALFFYTLLLFIKHIKSYLVYLGAGICIGLYLIAKLLKLELTLLSLEYIARSFALVFAIIFQKEIRKYIELIGFVGKKQLRKGRIIEQMGYKNDLIQACIKMAQEKTGGLIVIQGKYDIANFLDGGIKLDGLVSEELILSIFDPHSEGHDGALVITNERVSIFGTHLPLSTNFREIGKHGTRHSAALGLSENTDALCIVISEEKGTISIAKDSKLKTLKEFTDLEKELDKYIKTVLTLRPETLISHVIKHNLVLKLVALLFAGAAWAIV